MHHEQQCTIGYFPDPSTDKKYTKYQISITSNSSPVLPSTTQCIIIPFPAPATAVHNITYNQYINGHTPWKTRILYYIDHNPPPPGGEREQKHIGGPLATPSTNHSHFVSYYE